MARILNFGSLNLDQVYRVDAFVQPGETKSSLSLETHCGGKGLNQSVAAARAVDPWVTIAGTRKTIPGAKALSIAALVAGGGVPHRLGLSETILIFAEHRVFLASSSPEAVVSMARRGAPEKKVVVEVGSVAEGLTWAVAGADVIQTEKFSPEMVADLTTKLRTAAPHAIVAAAGGIDATNAAAYVTAGARVIVTSAPFTAKPVDVAVRIEASGGGDTRTL